MAIDETKSVGWMDDIRKSVKDCCKQTCEGIENPSDKDAQIEWLQKRLQSAQDALYEARKDSDGPAVIGLSESQVEALKSGYEKKLESKEKAIDSLERMVESKSSAIDKLQDTVNYQERIIKEQDETISDKDFKIKDQENEIKSMQLETDHLNDELETNVKWLNEKNHKIKRLEEDSDKRIRESIGSRIKYDNELSCLFDEHEKEIDDLKDCISEKEKTIEEQGILIKKQAEELCTKNKKIKEQEDKKKASYSENEYLGDKLESMSKEIGRYASRVLDYEKVIKEKDQVIENQSDSLSKQARILRSKISDPVESAEDFVRACEELMKRLRKGQENGR